MSITKLMINHLDKPFGISPLDICYSFLSDEKGPFTASVILDNKVIETKNIELKDSHAFSFDTQLEFGKKYTCKVYTLDSEASLEFETSIKLEAPFIKPINKEIFSPIFKKQFVTKGKIKEARLYIVGLGLYRAYINNERVGNLYLSPGFSDYDYYLRYQTYDVTNLLKEENFITIEMGDGWYKGRFGFWGDKTFGDEYKLSAHLRITFEDDSTQDILTDDTWKISSSYEVKNNIYDGEEVDFNLPIIDSLKTTIGEEHYNLIPDYGCGIVEKDILTPTLIISPKGEQILDFHQNMVGFVRFKGHLDKNQRLHMKHGEVLQKGCFYNDL